MQKTIRLMPVLMALAIFMGACVPQQVVTTQSPEEIAAKVATSVAMTVQAQNQIGTYVAQTVEAQYTPTSVELQFTATAVVPPSPLLFTPTPLVLAPSSGGGGGGGGGGGANPTPGKEQYSCAVVSEAPGDGTVMLPNKEFNIRWVVKNTGTKTWDATFSFSYFKGDNFTTTGPYLLGQEVKPGKTIALDLDAISPHDGVTYDHPKQFTMTWAIKGQGARFCTPYKAIIVSLTGK